MPALNSRHCPDRTVLQMHSYTRHQIGELLKYAAKVNLHSGTFGPQTVLWSEDGSATVTTVHTET